jgi:hypothetical protein
MTPIFQSVDSDGIEIQWLPLLYYLRPVILVASPVSTSVQDGIPHRHPESTPTSSYRATKQKK